MAQQFQTFAFCPDVRFSSVNRQGKPASDTKVQLLESPEADATYRTDYIIRDVDVKKITDLIWPPKNWTWDVSIADLHMDATNRNRYCNIGGTIGGKFLRFSKFFFGSDASDLYSTDKEPSQLTSTLANLDRLNIASGGAETYTNDSNGSGLSMYDINMWAESVGDYDFDGITKNDEAVESGNILIALTGNAGQFGSGGLDWTLIFRFWIREIYYNPDGTVDVLIYFNINFKPNVGNPVNIFPQPPANVSAFLGDNIGTGTVTILGKSVPVWFYLNLLSGETANASFSNISIDITTTELWNY